MKDPKYAAKQKERNRKYNLKYKRKRKYTPGQAKFSNAKFHYGITKEEYLNLVLKQNKRCAICQKKFTRIKQMCIDHNHATDTIRGVLCNHCNLALGLLKDSIQTCLNAANYLKENQ